MICTATAKLSGELMHIRPMRITDYESVYSLWQDTNGVGLRSLDDSLGGIERFLLRNPRKTLLQSRAGRLSAL